MRRLRSKSLSCAVWLGVLGTALAPLGARAGIDPYLGQISWVAFNFAPKNWALCNGQLLSIAQNTALFSLLGTTYGGDGQSTFALPDLRGRAPIHVGPNHTLGEKAGEQAHTLNMAEMPAHTHAVNVDAKEATIAAPGNTTVPAKTSTGTSAYAATTTASLATTAVTPQGGSQAHDNMKPYIAMTCIISLTGVFPSRS